MDYFKGETEENVQPTQNFRLRRAENHYLLYFT